MNAVLEKPSAAIRKHKHAAAAPVESKAIPESVPAAQAGRPGKLLALQCTWDIESVAGEIAKLGDRLDDYSTLTVEGLLRCYALRILALNAQLMAFLDDDGTTLGDMHRKVFRSTRPFEGGQA